MTRPSDIDRRSNQLARMLIAYGVGPGVSVVLALGGRGESVLAHRAVAKLGGDVVHIDPLMPRDRILATIANARADLGITIAPYSAPLPSSVHWLELDNPDIERECDEQWPGPLTVRDRGGALWARSLAELRWSAPEQHGIIEGA
ncbi:AMP-binding protein [Antrihabitans stalactiti]|jgi:non-ribosomal peptide synthetase component F|uniref:AMP-binding protein n=1 Tax=Antrihabitans stalactiti TaxID=2584121 RepID=A0A848KIP3_9NOCA|nr:AMP-binding protein [Antrihabitans stalactiti]NMN98575.1 AMP-binding protein [Antrihabitans stalactiti]